MAVHQLIPSFVSGDATGQAALHFQLLLRRLGQDGAIFAGEVEGRYRSLAHVSSALHPRPQDWVLYHHGIASPLSGQLLHLRCKKAVVFHNITPAWMYRGTPLEEPLVAGRAQLAALAGAVDVAIGVSDYNAAELREAGHQNIHTVRLFVEPRRFADNQADPKMARRLSGPSPTLLSVSRVVAHKRFEDLLALHGEVLRIRPEARLLIAGGFQQGSPYFQRLRRAARQFRGVHFLGRVSHAELVAAYRAASVFISMSEHEGFGVPLLEAMAAEVPVLAYAAAAVPETLGGRGVAFTEKRFAALAELAVVLSEDQEVRAGVLRGQQKRLAELSDDAARAELARALDLPVEGGRSTDSTRTGLPLYPELVEGRARARARRKPKVGIVVQRFGEVSGGAERHARDVAVRLAKHWDLTILTTCATDHLTWANELPEGEDEHEGLRVLRFRTARPRVIRSFNALSQRVFGQAVDRLAEEHWIAEQGPVTPGLFRHLAEESSSYDGFVVFTYLYAPTAWGVPMVGDRALVVPTAHDEPAFRFHAYSDVFERPRALLCNTPEEAELIRRTYPRHAPIQVVGVGVDSVEGDAERFRAKHQLKGPYVFYVGRLEAGKGIPDLLRHHRVLQRKLGRRAPQLVLAGTRAMPLPSSGVRYIGHVSEEEKADALAGASAVVIPSRFESLSLLALEAMAQGTPILANAESEVLEGQVRRSGAGFTYGTSEQFVAAYDELMDGRAGLSRKAKRFAAAHSWDKVVDAYLRAMRTTRARKR